MTTDCNIRDRYYLQFNNDLKGRQTQICLNHIKLERYTVQLRLSTLIQLHIINQIRILASLLDWNTNNTVRYN